MKYSIIISIVIIFCGLGCAGQYPLQKAYQKKDSVHHKLVEGEGHPKPVRVETNPVTDSVKYYFDKFLYFQKKMDKATGRAFVRFEDSCMKYYKLLYKLK